METVVKVTGIERLTFYNTIFYGEEALFSGGRKRNKEIKSGLLC